MIIIVSLFVLEAIIKIIVLGFVKGKGTYIKDPWNVLDFFIVIISLADIVISRASF